MISTPDGDVIGSGATRTKKSGLKDACAMLLNKWKQKKTQERY